METSTSTSISTSNKFTRLADDSAYKTHHYRVYSTSVYLLRPPQSHSSSRPWIITRESVKKQYTFLLRHPLTFKPHSFNFPRKLDFSKLDFTTLATFYSFDEPHLVDKLLVLPTQYSHPYSDTVCVIKCAMLALFGGGHLQGCPRRNRNEYNNGVNLSKYNNPKFDDIVVFKGNVYAVDRAGFTKLINNFTSVRKIRIGKIVIDQPLPGSDRFGWRKRFAVDGVLYLVVRVKEKLFQVFLLKRREMSLFWLEIIVFFEKRLKKFPWREYKNCIVFSEAAFPQYGNDCWEFTQSDDRQFGEEDIAVFRLADRVFAREGEVSGFPKIDWSPPAWVFNAEFQKHTVSVSSCQSESGFLICDATN